MPIVTDEKGLRFCRIIQQLMNKKQEELAIRLMASFAFDPIKVMEKLDDLEIMARHADVEGVRNIVANLPDPRRTDNPYGPPEV